MHPNIATTAPRVPWVIHASIHTDGSNVPYDYRRGSSKAGRMPLFSRTQDPTVSPADLAAVCAAVEAMQRDIGQQLERIHTLVNSNLTAAMRAELDATIREAAMMREVIALHEAAGRGPSQEATNAVTATDVRIAELRASISDRLQATELAETQVADAGQH